MFSATKIICSKCGKEKKFRTSGKRGRDGSICESGHFICTICGHKTLRETFALKNFLNPLLWVDPSLVGNQTSVCPVCGTKLRKITKEDLANL
ncbi:MAG: hypothetical protein KAS07_05355 [Candidatus Pacebacteria bacterium]|nr:hypothetical protein [Candidatus Paceibacterota bacterium]